MRDVNQDRLERMIWTSYALEQAVQLQKGWAQLETKWKNKLLVLNTENVAEEISNLALRTT